MNTTARLRAAALLAMAFLLAPACSDQGPQDELLGYVQNARARWRSVRPDRYSYDLYRICECTPEMAGPVSVTAQGSGAVAWRYDDGTEVGAALRPFFPSVDGLLDLIEDAIREGAFEVTVQYDQVTGVPVEFRIDYEQLVFDEEASYRVERMPTEISG
jgi:hypothetical protein